MLTAETLYSDPSFPAEVLRGAKLLDEKGPENWFNKVDVTEGKFHMRSTPKCLLGQLYGSYYTGLGILGIRRVDSTNYGFAECTCALPI